MQRRLVYSASLEPLSDIIFLSHNLNSVNAKSHQSVIIYILYAIIAISHYRVIITIIALRREYTARNNITSGPDIERYNLIIIIIIFRTYVYIHTGRYRRVLYAIGFRRPASSTIIKKKNQRKTRISEEIVYRECVSKDCPQRMISLQLFAEPELLNILILID